MLYVCPCLPLPHSRNVAMIRGVPTCTWSLHEATPCQPEAEPWIDESRMGTAGLIGPEDFRGDEYADATCGGV